MSLNGVTFIKGRGGVPKALAGEDHISGMMMYMADADLPAGFTTTARIVSFSTIAAVEAAGIVSTSAVWKVKAMHYHCSEFFRGNPSGILYVGLFKTPTATYDYVEIKEIANKAEGRIRQFGIYLPEISLSSTIITAIQAVAATLSAQYRPASFLVAADVASVAALTDLSASGQSNVSIVIGQDGEGVAKTLFDDTTSGASVTVLGLALGCLSRAAVHESISWVDKFPAGIDNPALADGDLLSETDMSVLETLNTDRFIFLRKHGGIAGSYFNDSHTMDLATSDYAYIEAVRTIDKAIRGIRTYVLPYLSSPLKVDPETGKLTVDVIKFLETLAGNATLQMQRAGELSGSQVLVDPDQDVLTTSEVNFVVELVQVGVMRKMKFTIGFTTQLS